MRASPCPCKSTHLACQNAHVPICLCNGSYDYMERKMKKGIPSRHKEIFSINQWGFKWMMRTPVKSDLIGVVLNVWLYMWSTTSVDIKKIIFMWLNLDSLHMSLSLSVCVNLLSHREGCYMTETAYSNGFYRSNYAAWCRRRTSCATGPARWNTQPLTQADERLDFKRDDHIDVMQV